MHATTATSLGGFVSHGKNWLGSHLRPTPWLPRPHLPAEIFCVHGPTLRPQLQQAAMRPHYARIRSDLVDSLAFPGIVDWFFDQGWQAWEEEEEREVADEVTTWRDLHGEIVREYNHGDLTLNAYLQQMDLASKMPRPDPDAVRCMTVHGAKGLEFKHVYLLGMAQEVLPSFHALCKGEKSKEVEEERRNCFVAITRVEETLTLTRAEEYYGYPKESSQFLAEMGIKIDE